MTRTMTFTATAQARPRGGIAITLPFDPADTWGDRDRYYLAGTIEHYPMRATVTPSDGEPMLTLGPAWCRDPRVGPGASLQVSLHPEGPQLDTISADFAECAARRTRGTTLLRVAGNGLSEGLRDLGRGSEEAGDAGAANRGGRRRPQGGAAGAIGPLTRKRRARDDRPVHRSGSRIGTCPAVVTGSTRGVRAGS
jgi:hypothetical protein